MFRSATFKLTLYYLAIIAVISLGFSVTLYQVTSHDLARGLEQQSQRISDNFPVFSDSPYLRFSEELEIGKRHIIARLIVSNGIVLTVAGFASYALARRTLRPIETAHDRQQRFTADVSHELRTPLTALKMESEVALMDTTASADTLRVTLHSNIEEAEKLTVLVSDLLRLSQLDAIATTTYGQVSIAEVLQSAVNSVRSMAVVRHMTIDLKLPDEQLSVRADPTLLEQLFRILMENAIKYSPNDSTVRVQAILQQPNVVITVTDTGIGIAKHELAQVFDRFYRADSARTASDTNGYGIGLSIAHSIAENHGAVISLTSKLGEGTTAKISLKAADQSPATKTSRTSLTTTAKKPAGPTTDSKPDSNP